MFKITKSESLKKGFKIKFKQTDKMSLHRSQPCLRLLSSQLPPLRQASYLFAQVLEIHHLGKFSIYWNKILLDSSQVNTLVGRLVPSPFLPAVLLEFPHLSMTMMSPTCKQGRPVYRKLEFLGKITKRSWNVSSHTITTFMENSIYNQRSHVLIQRNSSAIGLAKFVNFERLHPVAMTSNFQTPEKCL